MERDNLPAARLIECFKELEALRKECPDFAQQMDTMKRFPSGDPSVAIDTDATSFFFNFAAARCDGPEFLVELVTGMQQLPPELRERMVAAPGGLMSPSAMLVNRAWLAVAKRETPDWLACVAALDTARDKAVACSF